MTVVIAGPQAPYDRNPVQQVGSYHSSGIAPAAKTVRVTYTVPAGKKAQVNFVRGLLRRDGSTATPGDAQVGWDITPSGGSGYEVILGHVSSGTVATQDGNILGASIVLLAGDKIDLWTFDNSTGGSFRFNLAYEAIEFDA